MMTRSLVIILAVLAVYFGFRAVGALRVYLKLRDARLITCPETKEVVLVEVSAKAAAREALLDEPCLRVRNCSRWPLRQDCGQDCLSQIEVRPSELKFSTACRSS